MELDAGRILIDGVDIATLGVRQLRESMSLIPQVPRRVDRPQTDRRDTALSCESIRKQWHCLCPHPPYGLGSRNPSPPPFSETNHQHLLQPIYLSVYAPRTDGSGRARVLSVASARSRLAARVAAAPARRMKPNEKIGLAILVIRSLFLLCVQVPVLFTGTMRFNLDPFGQFSDAEVWGALRRAHLGALVESHALGLDMVLSEGGSPLSAGQKQLVALARALLRRLRVRTPDGRGLRQTDTYTSPCSKRRGLCDGWGLRRTSV
jgi:hypothetical protein